MAPTRPVLGEDHDGHHALLAEIAQQLVHLQGEVGLLRHGVLVAGERVQHDDAGAGFDSVADHGRQFAGRELGGVHVLQAEQAGALVLRQVDAHAAAALQQHAARLVERHHQRLLATVHGGGQELQRQRGLAGAGRPDDERAGAAVEPAAQQTIELGDAAADGLLIGVVGVVLGGDQAREDGQAAAADDVVVEAALELAPAQLEHPQSPSVAAKHQRLLLQPHDAVRKAVQAGLLDFLGHVVEEEGGAVEFGQEVLQGQDLAAVAQRALREQPDLGDAVEHHAMRLQPLDLLHHHVDRFAELEVGGVKHGLVALRVERQLRRHQLEDIDAVQRPAMAGRAGDQLGARLRERDVEAALAAVAPIHQEL